MPGCRTGVPPEGWLGKQLPCGSGSQPLASVQGEGRKEKATPKKSGGLAGQHGAEGKLSEQREGNGELARMS